VESTWETRDLPVLEAVVRYFDENAGMLYPQVHDLVDITGRDPMEVYRALKALEPDYVRLREVMSGADPKPAYGPRHHQRGTSGGRPVAHARRGGRPDRGGAA
jgi:hypothetical protein